SPRHRLEPLASMNGVWVTGTPSRAEPDISSPTTSLARSPKQPFRGDADAHGGGWSMRSPRQMLAALVLALAASPAMAQGGDLPVVNAAMEATGTFSWIVHAMDYFGTAEANGIRVVGTPYASKQATEIALRSGEADVKVDDFLAPVLLRQAGINASGIYPYATAIGGLVVPVDSDIGGVEDLDGRTIAAGALRDKSVLILRTLTI